MKRFAAALPRIVACFLFQVPSINMFHHFPSQDRKITLRQIDEVFNTEVGAKDLVGDIQVTMLHPKHSVFFSCVVQEIKLLAFLESAHSANRKGSSTASHY